VKIEKMEYKLFNLSKAQKKGTAHISGATDTLINTLVVVVLTVSLAGTVFTYLGSGATGFANATINGGAPQWLVVIFPILIAVTFVYLILKLMKR
jgi:hypothetical protein